MDKKWHNEDGMVIAHRCYCDGCGQSINGLYYRIDDDHIYQTCSRECAVKVLNKLLSVPIKETPDIYIDAKYYKPYGEVPADVFDNYEWV